MIYDISPLVHEGLGVFPGDQKFERKQALSFAKKDHLDLSSILTTLHIGAHVDAPSHYHPQGPSIDQMDLEIYLGPCQVLKLQNPKHRVQVSDVKAFEIRTERVLLQTNSFPDPDHWNSDFCGLSEEVVDYFANKKVKLLGIDTPSMDPENDHEVKAHKAIYKRDLRILEGLLLAHVPQNEYILVALPLNIKGAEASPVRAVLVEKTHFLK
jgi:arylformamidase